MQVNTQVHSMHIASGHSSSVFAIGCQYWEGISKFIAVATYFRGESGGEFHPLTAARPTLLGSMTHYHQP